MKNKDIIKYSNKTITRYSSDLIKRGLSFAVSINNNKLDFCLENWLEEAQGLFEDEEYKKTLELLEKIIEIASNYQNHIFWELRAKTLAELERYQEAISCYYKSYEIKQDLNYLLELFLKQVDRLSFELEKYEEALIFNNVAINIHPNNSKVWHSKAATLSLWGKDYESLILLDRAIAITPNNCGYWFDRGIILISLKKYEQALSSFETIIAIQPDNFYGWYWKGMVLNDDLKR